MLTKAEATWTAFSAFVIGHIRNYVVPQYGDEDTELAKDWSAEDCVKQAQTYLARFNSSQRKDEKHLDMLKAAHWIQKAYFRLPPKN